MKIYDNEHVIYDGPAWAATDALVIEFVDDNNVDYEMEDGATLYEVVCDFGEAISKGEDTSAYEALFGVTCE